MKKFTLFVLLLSLVMGVSAIPARRVSKVVKQSDGTMLTVVLTGDESFHYYRTLDGMPLVREVNGDFSYARLTNDGTFVTTSVLAHSAEIRSIEEHSLIAAAKANDIDGAIARTAARRAERYDAPRRKAQTIRPEGVTNIPVILIEFSDSKFSFTKDDLKKVFNAENYKGPKNPFTEETAGSLRDYYVTQSGGKFKPNFVVSDIITLSNPISYYGANDSKGNDINPQQMVIDACRAADANIDFSICDNDGDGKVEFLYCVYAGYSESSGAPAETIWPHQWYLSSQKGTITLDGVKLDCYACSSELVLNAGYESKYGKNLNGIGSCAHEFSHCLGLPDFYDTSGSSQRPFGMDYWDLMDYGCYNAEGFLPIGYSAYELDFLGWRELPVLTEKGNYTLEAISAGGHGYKIVNDLNPNEYYVIENRQREGWDRYIFNSGMLITHVDYSESVWYANTVNNDKSHQRFTLIPADNELLTYNQAPSTKEYRESLQGDVWPGTTGNTELTDTSIPAAKVFTGGYMSKPITNIKHENGIVSFSFCKEGIRVPQVMEATDITATGFTANWDSQEDVVEYKVTLEIKDWTKGSNEVLFAEDFTSLSTNNESVESKINSYTTSKGWSASNLFSANGALCIGSISKKGTLVAALTTTEGSSTLSLRIKRYNEEDENAVLCVTVMDGSGNEVTKGQYVAESEFSTKSLEIADAGEYIISFTTDENYCSRVVVDDIVLTQELEYSYKAVDTVKTSANSYTFTGLVEGEEYRYCVSAIDEIIETEASEYAYVDLLGTGIESIAGTSANDMIYDLTGHRIYKIKHPGIYIINGKKTLVK